MNANTKQKGFTIIEVVLVLAIAALIFLMVFIALPALQRGQRDTGRKQDANTVITALNTWKGNHRGALPDIEKAAELTSFQNDYVKQLGQYDVGEDGTFKWENEESPSFDQGDELNQIGIVLGVQCNDTGTDITTDGASRRSAAVVITLEASEARVCIDG